jgi:hypothetical protein
LLNKFWKAIYFAVRMEVKLKTKSLSKFVLVNKFEAKIIVTQINGSVNIQILCIPLTKFWICYVFELFLEHKKQKCM